MSLKTIILAAGMGTRMKSKLPKVLHKIAGEPLVSHVVDLAKSMDSEDVVVVIGNGSEQVEKVLSSKGVSFALQAEQLGTGHALLCAREHLNSGDHLLVLYGDAPLLKESTLQSMFESHLASKNAATVLTAVVDNPTGYGRMVKDENGSLLEIVEEKDADDVTRAIREINSGIYLFNLDKLNMHLDELDNNNKQKEYYLTDFIKIFKGHGYDVGTFVTESYEEILGINTRVQLNEADQIMRLRINTAHMLEGVTIINPDDVYIEKNVKIGRDTIIYPGTFLKGNTQVGEDCIIGPRASLENMVIGDAVEIKDSTLVDSKVGDFTKVGPYAFVRPGSDIGKHVKIGDFVEIKNSVIGDNSKVSHLTYVGDGDVGNNVNLGCGVVFVNYDGKAKHRSVIDDNAFIGCNTNLVSPVHIQKNAYVAAGTTVTSDVPEGSLAIGRVKQEIKEEWVYKKNRLKEKK